MQLELWFSEVWACISIQWKLKKSTVEYLFLQYYEYYWLIDWVFFHHSPKLLHIWINKMR